MPTAVQYLKNYNNNNNICMDDPAPALCRRIAVGRSATFGLGAEQQKERYDQIIVASRDGGTATSNALAVLRLMTVSNDRQKGGTPKKLKCYYLSKSGKRNGGTPMRTFTATFVVATSIMVAGSVHVARAKDQTIKPTIQFGNTTCYTTPNGTNMCQTCSGGRCVTGIDDNDTNKKTSGPAPRQVGGGNKLPSTTTTAPSALTSSPSLLGGSGTGSTVTTGPRAKPPTGSATTLGH
jgi:hypothetical protein